jgi:hypothetical protein
MADGALAEVRGGRGYRARAWLCGVLVQYGMSTLDYAFVAHPYLVGQHRLSFEMGPWTGRAR